MYVASMFVDAKCLIFSIVVIILSSHVTKSNAFSTTPKSSSSTNCHSNEFEQDQCNCFHQRKTATISATRLLSTTESTSPGDRSPIHETAIKTSIAIPTSRRSLFQRALPTAGIVFVAATTLTNKPPAALAEKGAGANQALPALIPSPIRPTGEMAKTCDVVALGREDVCLVPLNPPSLYDKMLLKTAMNKVEDGSQAGRLLRAVSDMNWDVCNEELSKIEGGKPIKALKAACKKKDGPTAAKAVIKLSEII